MMSVSRYNLDNFAEVFAEKVACSRSYESIIKDVSRTLILKTGGP